MEFRILGPLEVRDNGRVLELGGAKQRAVLALLLLQANEVVALDRLIDGIWGERPPDTAAAAVHGSVSRLRKVLEPNGAPYQVIRTQAPGYVFAAGPEAATVTASSALPPKERPRSTRETLRARQTCYAKLWPCGAVRPWRTSRSRSPTVPSSTASTRNGSRRSRSGSTPTSLSGATRCSFRSWKPSSPVIHCASVFAGSSWSRSTGPAGKRTRWRRIATRAGCSTKSSESHRGLRCVSWSGGYCFRTRSSGRRARRHARHDSFRHALALRSPSEDSPSACSGCWPSRDARRRDASGRPCAPERGRRDRSGVEHACAVDARWRVPRSPRGRRQSVWVANAGDHTVSRIESRTGQVTTTKGLTGAPMALNVSRGVVWIAMSHDGQPTSILRLTERPERVRSARRGACEGPGTAVSRALTSGSSGLWASLLARSPTRSF